MALVKCLYCGQQFNRDKEEWVKPRANRYAHKNCYENRDTVVKEKEDFFAFVKNILGTQYNYNKVNSQSNKYLKEGKTYKELEQTLDYFYNIKKNSIDNAQGGIGIIPYVYEEAMQYYSQKEELSNKVVEKDTTKPTIKDVKIKRYGFQKIADLNYFHLE